MQLLSEQVHYSERLNILGHMGIPEKVHEANALQPASTDLRISDTVRRCYGISLILATRNQDHDVAVVLLGETGINPPTKLHHLGEARCLVGVAARRITGSGFHGTYRW